MKIAMFTDSYYPMVNGIVTAMSDLARGLADNGHEVYIVAPVADKNYVEEYYPGITVLRVPAVDASFYTGFKWSSVLHKPTYDILKKAKIDLVHFMTPFTISVFGILVARFLRIPLIGTYHTFVSELNYIRQFFPYAGPSMQKVAWRFTNTFYNRSELITCPTEMARDELIKNGAKPEVLAVSNGIKLDSFDNSKSAIVKDLYNKDGDIVLYVGRIAPEKSMDILLEAFKGICEEDDTTKFVVVGDGPSLDECKDYVNKNKLEDRIFFLGLIPTAELKKSGLFGASKVFATASTTETQSITVLEAEANGIPAIGPAAKGILNVIEDGVSGYLVEPNSVEEIKTRIQSILSDDDLYRRLSKGAVEVAKVHDFEVILKEWIDRYSSVIDNYRAKRSSRRSSIRRSVKETV